MHNLRDCFLLAHQKRWRAIIDEDNVKPNPLLLGMKQYMVVHILTESAACQTVHNHVLLQAKQQWVRLAESAKTVAPEKPSQGYLLASSGFHHRAHKISGPAYPVAPCSNDCSRCALVSRPALPWTAQHSVRTKDSCSTCAAHALKRCPSKRTQ